MYFAAPTSSFGYYRGNPMVMGQGSGQGVNMAGTNTFAAGQGGGVAGGWHPTVLYLGALIIAEMFVFAFISKHL
jgi:hypothetical protein